MRTTSAKKTIDLLRQLSASYGLPEGDVIVSNNGPQLTSTPFAAFMHLNGIQATTRLFSPTTT